MSATTKPLHLIDPNVVRSLSSLCAFQSLSAIVAEWLMIMGGIIVFAVIDWWWTYPILVAWIGARQHALAVLMHEASHYRLCSNRKLNDFIGDSFLAAPLFIGLQNYRRDHLAHHRHANTSDDPDWVTKASSDWVFPKTKGRLFRLFLFDLLGLNSFEFIGILKRYIGENRKQQSHHRSSEQTETNSKQVSLSYSVAKFSFFVVAISTATYFYGWLAFLLFWIVPLFTWFKFSLRLRNLADHFGIKYDHPLRESRTTYANLIERLFLAPRNTNFHLEHHVFPSVPYYRLPKLHQILMENDVYRAEAHISSSYFQVIKECCSHHNPTKVPL